MKVSPPPRPKYYRREGFPLIRCHRLVGGGLVHVMADGMLSYCRWANVTIIPYIHSNVKGWPPFVHRGNARFFFTQNAKSQDWSVVWGSNLFWHTLWTLPALFGSLTPPKSICTQRHSLQKFLSKKMQILGPAGPISAFWAQKIFGA